MSRIGKQPVAIPAGVKVAVADGKVKVEGPKGKLEFTAPPEHEGRRPTARHINVDAAGRRPPEPGAARPDPGLINNMVVGVTKGYEKKLKIEGVGYQAAAKGKGVELTVGYANQIVHQPPEGVTVAVPDPTTIVDQRRGQAEGRPVRRRDPRQPASPSRTRARASGTRTKSSAARKASRSPPAST